MRYIFVTLFLFPFSCCFGQLNESFSDGQFLTDPAWTGLNPTCDFVVTDNMLRSNHPGEGGIYYLSTSSSLSLNAQWELRVTLKFNTSGSNFTDIYLIADQADLVNDAINGYFVRIGGAEDEISLYRRSGPLSSAAEIIDGKDGSIDSSDNMIRIRVKRTQDGVFSLEREVMKPGSAFVTEGVAEDLMYKGTSHFGIYIRQSVPSFFYKHFFDDIIIQPIPLDTIPPRPISAFVLDSNTIEVQFDEPVDTVSARSITNFLLAGSLNSLNAVVADLNPTKLRLMYSDPFKSGEYELLISGISDLNGNPMPETGKISVHYIRSYKARAGDIIVTEILADPTPARSLPSSEFIELKNVSDEHISLEQWKIGDGVKWSRIADVIIPPDSYLILCAKTDTGEFSRYGLVAGLSSWSGLNNSGETIFLSDPEGFVVDSLAYSNSWYGNAEKKQGGWSLERLDLSSLCEPRFNWTASIDSAGGTPGRQNSVHSTGYDMRALKADSLKQASDTSLTVYFNKPLNEATLIAENFVLQPYSNLKNITADTGLKEVTIQYKETFIANTEYNLSVLNIKDCSGNVLTDTFLTFHTPGAPVPIPERLDTARILITEIFADPSPEVGLPQVEFIELYNPGQDTIELDQWTLSDPANTGTIRNHQILPKEYLIVCPAADTIHYKAFGKTVGISPWPSLNNSSDQIALRSSKGRLVDSVVYSDSWYRHTSKKQGGWTLEKMHLFPSCESPFNWTASIDSTGGTPGRENSIYAPDGISLKTDSLVQNSDTSISIYFNRYVDETTLTAGNFILSPASGFVSEITFDIKQLTLNYSQAFASGKQYGLTISGLKDCGGNLVPDTTLIFNTPEAPFPVPEELDTAKIIISEIFADPSPEVGLPLVEFIELFNPGQDTIDLDEWTISDPVSTGTIRNQKILPLEYVILCRAADTVHYKTFGNTIGISPWPSLNNASDQVSLRSLKARLVDSVAYADSWYGDPVKKQGGWSLEIVDLQSICAGAANWKASISPTGGTPGAQNSVHASASGNEPLQLQGLIQADSASLILYFNRNVNSFAVRPGDFSLNNGMGSPAAIHFDSADHSVITIEYSSPIGKGLQYKLSIQNICDCSGQVISPGQEGINEFFVPEDLQQGDLLVSEILFNPRPGGADFVEIYNNSGQTVDIGQVFISNGIDSTGVQKKLGEGQVLLNSGAYLAVTANPENIRDEYRIENPDNFLEISSLPPFNDDRGTVALNTAAETLDVFNYQETMHFALLPTFEGVSLERSSLSRQANEAGNFRSASAAAGYATPGYANSQEAVDTTQEAQLAIASKTFSPDNDGFEDLLQISYKLDQPGMLANISIFNDKGLLVKKLHKNYTLDTQGMLVWDGMDELDTLSPTGIYIMYAEIFDLHGRLKKFRKSFVLASKF